MRRFALACFTCVGLISAACTMPNPQFDSVTSDSGSDERTDLSESAETDAEAEAEAEAEGEAEAESESEAGEDLPDPLACEFAVSDGLALKWGDPEYFGNTCPNAVDVYAQITLAEGGEATTVICDANCEQCNGAHPLSAFPMTITDYLPEPSTKCLKLQTTTSFGHDDHACFWGSISLHNPETLEAVFVAVAHSAEPTPFGAEFLAGQIPAPKKGGSCNCDAVGQSNECCYTAPNAPEFWYYPFAQANVYPGGYEVLPFTNSQGLSYYFKLFQSQKLYGCENPDLDLSWAVVPR
jgi:hypothetical protein